MNDSRSTSPAGNPEAQNNPPALERIARWATRTAGGDGAFATALGMVVLWLLSGPLFGFSADWLYHLSSVTGIIAFLLLFLLQRSQNIDSRATQLKLNEVVAALEGASNRLIAIEHRSEKELADLTGHYQEISGSATQDANRTRSLSVDAAVQKAAEDSGS